MYFDAISILLSILLMPAAIFGADLEDHHESIYYRQNIVAQVAAEHMEELNTSFVTTARLNLRPTPSTDLAPITLVQTGRVVEVIDFLDGEWFRVDYQGTIGYMYAEFLTPATPEVMEIIETASASVSYTGNAEMIPWSQMTNILPQNTPFTVVDVRTGISWQMKSFSHGNHADVFTVTQNDTNAMLRAFGGSWTWTPRPILVQTGGRTVVASMSGMPHAGGQRNGNGMNGHVCIHFYGSRTHNGNRSHEAEHQNAVQEARRSRI